MAANAFRIQIAGLIVEVQPLYERVADYCRRYRVDWEMSDPEAYARASGPESGDTEISCMASHTDIRITMTEEDLELEQEIQYANSHRPGDKAELEILALYRKLTDVLSYHDTFLMHGSVIAVDGEAYMFTAKSGTGKSTHSALWRQYFGPRAVMVNDDKPLITIRGGQSYACGTPWDGKHHLSNNLILPLKAICILERGRENEIYEISYTEAFPMLLQQTHRSRNPVVLTHTLELLESLRQSTHFFRLHCNQNPEAARISYEGMQGLRD